MKAWTIEQLMLANELCFVDDFSRLWYRHAPVDLKDDAVVYVMNFKAAGGLIAWIFRYNSRADLPFPDGVALIDAIISDLLNPPERNHCS